jgi:ribosomal protein S18 acetylase RimI-like enzyme
MSRTAGSEAGGRAVEWIRGHHEAVCDLLEPWEFGTVVRASRYPDYYDYNLVRVERDPGMPVDELVAVADDALQGLEHRRFDFESVDWGAPLRDDFEQAGWRTMRLVLMRHEGPLPHAELELEAVAYDAVQPLREAWYTEDFPDEDPGDYHAQAREVAMARDTRVLAAREGGEAVGFAQLVVEGDAAEVTNVYVRSDRRGGGLGTALTCAAMAAAGSVAELWIAADDEGRPKELYGRLGFRTALTTIEFTLTPG